MRVNTIGLVSTTKLIPFISFSFSDYQINFMLDSGSQGNIIKIGLVPKCLKINKTETVILRGISDETFSTFGTVKFKILGSIITFHVVSNNFQIPFSGILGSNFFFMKIDVLLTLKIKHYKIRMQL